MSAEQLQSYGTSQALSRIIRLLVLAELTLLATTWRLWFHTTPFPRIPLHRLLESVPRSLTIAGTTAFIASLVWLLAAGHTSRGTPPRLRIGTTVVLGFGLVAMNQHCLQPWHWLFLLTLISFLLLSAHDIVSVLRWLVASIYFFAALSRLGPAVATGMTPRIVQTLLQLIGLTAAAADPQIIAWGCLLATMLELILGVLLLLSGTRRMAVLAAVIMHGTLILVLGPAGLQQEPSVLAWNLFLAIWVPLLFATRTLPASAERPARVVFLKLFIIAWPMLALVGIADNWTGWQLYSPRPEILQLQVHVDVTDQLPEDLQPHVTPPAALQDWCNVRLDRWSLSSVAAPLYPQARFQFALALIATRNVRDEQLIRATLDAPQSPFWWRRTRTPYNARAELQDELSGYWLTADSSGR